MGVHTVGDRNPALSDAGSPWLLGATMESEPQIGACLSSSVAVSAQAICLAAKAAWTSRERPPCVCLRPPACVRTRSPTWPRPREDWARRPRSATWPRPHECQPHTPRLLRIVLRRLPRQQQPWRRRRRRWERMRTSWPWPEAQQPWRRRSHMRRPSWPWTRGGWKRWRAALRRPWRQRPRYTVSISWRSGAAAAAAKLRR